MFLIDISRTLLILWRFFLLRHNRTLTSFWKIVKKSYRFGLEKLNRTNLANTLTLKRPPARCVCISDDGGGRSIHFDSNLRKRIVFIN